MVEDNEIIEIRNLTNHNVTYVIPEKNVRRVFGAGESKKVEAGELRELYFKSGGAELLQEYLAVNNQELAAEFGVTEDSFTHEYSWTIEDVDRVLLEGSLDELADALDYAPIGIQETIVDEAVKLKIPDMNKRSYIQKKTDRNVSKMIEYETYLQDIDGEDDEPQPTQRRVRRAGGDKRTGRRTS